MATADTPRTAKNALQRLRRIVRTVSPAASEEKRLLLRVLARSRCGSAREVEELHEHLCFLRAYPDEPEVLELVEDLLAGFSRRRDLRAHAAELADTGIAGTPIHAEFYWFTAKWLVERWPAQVRVDWEAFETQDRLDALMYPLLLEHERLAYEDSAGTLARIVDGLRAPAETDAAYLVRSFVRSGVEPMLLEHLYESVGLPLVLEPGAETPSRTRALCRLAPTRFQLDEPALEEGSIPQRIARGPVSVRRLSTRLGRQLVDLGRGAMITWNRDLFAFIHADARDALAVDFGDGLTFACLGLLPERRHLLYTQYIFIVLRNGVPAGYVQACVLFGSAEINFTIFDTFRGVEASRILTHSLALTRHVFDVDAFTINTQQLGEGNPEAIKTGAWWFYYKHGFRPAGSALNATIRRELLAKRRDPAHRSDVETLEELGSHELHLFLDHPREDIVGRVDVSRIGWAAIRSVAKRYGASGRSAARTSAAGAWERLGLSAPESWPRGEREAWGRWGPLLMALPDVERWTRAEKRALVEVVRAKGGVSELEYSRRLHAHPRLQSALLALARQPGIGRE